MVILEAMFLAIDRSWYNVEVKTDTSNAINQNLGKEIY